jgi:hypothetical protein
MKIIMDKKRAKLIRVLKQGIIGLSIVLIVAKPLIIAFKDDLRSIDTALLNRLLLYELIVILAAVSAYVAVVRAENKYRANVQIEKSIGRLIFRKENIWPVLAGVAVFFGVAFIDVQLAIIGSIIMMIVVEIIILVRHQSARKQQKQGCPSKSTSRGQKPTNTTNRGRS